MKPVVSIIIPAYNADKYIRAAVDSALQQSYKNIEVIVINDGSTDSTADKLKHYEKKIRYIYQNNQGESTARNQGVKEAQGKYIMFLDADDMLFPQAVEKGIQALAAYPHFKAVYGQAFNFQDGTNQLLECKQRPVESGNLFQYTVRGRHLAQGQFIIERSCIEEVGGFDTDLTYGEDWQFLLKITKKYDFLFTPFPFFKRRFHNQMQTTHSLLIKGSIVKRRLAILEKTFGQEAEEIKEKYLDNKTLAQWYGSEGLTYLHQGLKELAYKNIRISLKLHLWQPDLYLMLLKTHLPGNIREGIRKARRILGKKKQAKTMKIAICASGLEHVKRGAEVSSKNLAYALLEKGIDVTLYKGSDCRSSGNGKAIEKVLGCLRRNARITERILKIRPACLWHIGLGQANEIEQTSFSLSFLREAIYRRFDIIYTKAPIIANFLQTASKLHLINSKVILAHGTEEPLEFLKKFDYIQHLAPYYLQEAALQGAGSRKWFAIPNFVDTEKFKPREREGLRKKWGFKENDFIILTVSAIKRHHKRLDYLMRELSKAQAKNVVLVIVGAQTEDTSLVKTLGKNLLAGRVRFFSDLRHNQMPDIYNLADLFVLGSLKEMMPNALIEALASGLPCICNTHPVMQWIVDEGGSCIDMTQEGALARTIEQYSDKDTRAKVSKKARTQVINNFSKDIIVKQIVDMYQSVLNGK